MNLKNYYWYFQSAVPERICDDISKYGKQLQEQMAVTGAFGGKKLNKKQVIDLKTLSDPKNYKGGELEFDFRNMDPDKKRNIHKCKEILPKGSVVVFPSFVWHRVCPVKSGERNSLVIWNLGYPFQ